MAEFGFDTGFGGPGDLVILAVAAIATNALIVEFDRAPLADDTTNPHSATHTDNWGVVAVDPTYYSDTSPEGIPTVGAAVPTRQPLLARVERNPDDETQVILYFDGPLQEGVVHSISMSPEVCGALDESPTGVLTWSFLPPSSFTPFTRARAVEERYRDFDFVTTRDGTPIGGTYRVDATGDIALQGGKESLRKRIYRRLFSGRGSWAFLRDYGLAVGLKSLGTRAELQSLASRAAAQIQREPDVVSATVTVQLDTRAEGAFVIVSVWVTTYSGLADRYVYENPVG